MSCASEIHDSSYGGLRAEVTTSVALNVDRLILGLQMRFRRFW